MRNFGDRLPTEKDDTHSGTDRLPDSTLTSIPDISRKLATHDVICQLSIEPI